MGQFGTPGHYVLGATAAKYGIPLDHLHLVALQSNANVISALLGGQIDGTVTVLATPLIPLIDRGEIRVLSWVGDEMPFQDRAIFTATKTADARPDLVQRFLHAYRRGAHDFTTLSSAPMNGRMMVRPRRRRSRSSPNMSINRRSRCAPASPISIRSSE